MKKVVLGVFLLALLAPFASAVETLPPGPWKDLLHLGATQQDRIVGGQIDTDYLGGEASIMPAPGDQVAGIEGATSDPMVWTALHDDDGTWQPNLDNFVMYYHIYILSPDQKDVTFQYGHDDDLKVWNNGEIVISQGASLANQTQDGVLYAGLNSITIKHREGGGADWFKIAVTDRSGNDITDLQYALSPVGMNLSNAVTGSTEYTNQALVNVEWIAEGLDVTGYAITETDTEPTAFQTTAPTAYTLSGTEGDYTVYGWIQLASGQVLSSVATITYTSLAPVAVAKDVAVESLPPNYPAAVIYPADVDDGSYDPNNGEILTGADFYYLTCDQDQTPDQPYITLDAGTTQTYLAALNVTNEAGISASIPFSVNIVAAADTTTDAVVWSGGAGLGNQQWTRGLNWSLDQPPANPLNNSVTFGEAGSVAADDDSVTNVLDAGAAEVVSTNTEPFSMTLEDVMSISANGGTAQLASFDEGDLSAQQVADALNAYAIGYTASATTDGKVKITADNVASSSLAFANITGDAVGKLGLPADETVIPDWAIGKLFVKKSEIEPIPADYSHTTDLNGGELFIKNGIEMSQYGTHGNRGTVNFTFKNGTVQIGKADALASIIVTSGYGDNIGANLTFAPGTTFVPHLNYLRVADAYKAAKLCSLDLRGTQVANETLDVRWDLLVGNNNNANAAIMLDNSTGLKTLNVGRTLTIAHCNGGDIDNNIWARCYIGDPANNYMLPADFNIKVGDSATDFRGNLNVGWGTYAGKVEGILQASSGGNFDAYVNRMEIGTRDGTYKDYVNGLLDLSQMDSAVINATAVRIGVGKDNADARVDGRVLLPAGGSMVADSLTMGDTSEGSMGLIDLPSATLTVNQSLTMKTNSKIAVHVQGTSCGLDLSAGIAASIASSALIEINFEQDQNAEETGTYYGLRWAGNHVGDLKPLMDAGTIVVNNATAKPITTVSYDETADATYVTVVDSLPLTAVGKNLTIEVSSADPTVVIYPEDLEAGSFDPNGYTIVEYLVNSTDDQTVDQPYVTLSGFGDHTVTLLVKNDNDPADVASTECTVTLEEPSAPTNGNVTWSGGAALTGAERNEWIWGSNWVGGVAPANPTDATITFTAQGMGTSKLDGSRAMLIGTRTEPFLLYDGDQIGVDANGTLTTYTFSVDQFTDIALITAQEIVAILNADAVGFQAEAANGTIVLKSDVGTDASLQVVDLVDGTAARLGLPTTAATAQRVVGTIEFLNPVNSGVEPVEHTVDLNGLDLTIADALKCSYYFTSGGVRGTTNATFTNGRLILGSDTNAADILVADAGYSGQSTGNLTIGPAVSLQANLNTVILGGNSYGGGSGGILDLRGATLEDANHALAMNKLWLGRSADLGRGGQSQTDALIIGTNVKSLQVAESLIVGAAQGCVLAYIGDPDNDQKLPAGTSIKLGSPSAQAELKMATSGYSEAAGKIIASSGGTFEANVSDMIVAQYDGPRGITLTGTLDLAAMDSCSVTATNMTIGTGNPISTNSRVFGTIALPSGTAVVDTLTMGGSSFGPDATAVLQLNGTDYALNTAATLHTGSSIDIQLDGTSSGLDLDALATLTVDDGAAINVTFAAASTSDPYYGIRWAGDHQTELQALIDAGKITADTTAVGADAVVFADADFTYFGIQSAAPTWPIEGDANMDCKVNIIDLIFVRNRLNKDVTTGDNWQADVNSDGKVNIIDLIYVRNRLNNKCTP